MKLIFLIQFLVLMLSAATAHGQFKPVIPASYSSRDLPMLELALRDPNIARNLISDDLYFEQTFEQIKAQEAELRIMKGQRRLELLGNLYRNYINMSYFLEDVRAGRANSVAGYQNITTKITNLRKAAMSYGQQLARSTKNKRLQAEALYHVLTSQYLLGMSKGSSVKNLKRLAKFQNGYLKRRSEMLSAIHDIEYGNATRGIATLNGIMKSLPKSGSISSRLAIARSYAGLNRNGRKIKQSDKRYRNYLYRSATQARKLSRQDREAVFSFTVAVWRQAEGSRADWNKYPFKLSHYQDLDLAQAVYERRGLDYLEKKDYRRAIARYQRLSKRFENTPRMVQIDDRIIMIRMLDYQKNARTQAYEKALLSYAQKYETLSASQSAHAKSYTGMKLSIEKRHQQLVNQLLTNAAKHKAGKRQRLAAIAIANRYLAGKQNPVEYTAVKTRIGRIYVLANMHEQAVATYIDLKNRSEGTQALQFLNLAIHSQSILAKWPKQAPWDGIAVAHRTTRTQLLSLFSEKHGLTKSWNDLAHVGLLHINLGNGKLAFTLWTKQLSEQPKGVHAQKAAGFMLVAYRKSASWQELEDLSRFSINASVRPIHRGKFINPTIYLADALFYGGKQHFTNSNFAQAIAKLSEFTQSFKRDTRRPEGMFILGQAFHNDAKHPESIETMMALVNEYPRSKFFKPALLMGGEWSIPMAYEEQTIFFYQKFVDSYVSDPQTPAIRMTLADLYMGRDLYGNAARVHQAHAQDPQVDVASQVDSALAVMEIEERFGEVRYAKWGAERVKQIAKENPQSMARVLGFEARVAASRKDYRELHQIESRLSQLPFDDRDVVEALAQVRFILAQKQAEETKNKFFNLELTAPEQTLAKQHSLFLKVQKAYERVCEPGNSSYCAPAMMELSEATNYTLKAIEDITIAQTLDEQTVNSFEKRKLSIISYLSDTASKADNRALGITENGLTTPDWSSEILGVNQGELSIDEAQTTSGNGYVQWAPVVDHQSENADSF